MGGALDVLMISSGDRILRAPISNEVNRHIAYADRAGVLQMLVYSHPAHNLRPTEIRPNLIVHPIHARNRASYIVSGIIAGRQLCRRRRMDLITTQDPFDTAVIGACLSKRYGVPLEIQNHSNFYADHEWARQRRGFSLARQLGRRMLPCASLLRVLNSAEREAYVRMGLPSDRIRILPTPVDVSRFLNGAVQAREHRETIRSRWGFNPDDSIVVWVGRMVDADKRLLFWLGVAARLAEELPSIRFVLVGDGPQRGLLEERARELGLSDCIVFAGLVPNSELPALLSAVDIYMHTSRHEGFGKVIVEAQAAGLPVVAVNSHGPSSIVVDGETGYLVEPDVNALAERVVDLCRDEEKRKHMGAAGRRHVRQHYQYERMVDAIVSAWEETVERDR